MNGRFSRIARPVYPMRGGGGGGAGGGPPGPANNANSSSGKSDNGLPSEFQQVMDVFEFKTPGQFLGGSTQALEDTIKSYEELTPRLQNVQKDLLLGNLSLDGVLGTAMFGNGSVPGLYGGGQSGNGYMGDIAPKLGQISRSIDPLSSELANLLGSKAKKKAKTADEYAAIAGETAALGNGMATENAAGLNAAALGLLGLGETAQGLADGGMSTALGQSELLAGLGDEFLAAGQEQLATANPAEELLRARGIDFAKSKGELTPLQRRNLEQTTRRGQVARGTAMGQPAAYEEAGNRFAAELAKEQRDLGLGAELLGLADQLEANQYNQAISLAGAGSQMAGQSQGILGSGIANAGAAAAPTAAAGSVMGQNQDLLGASLQPYMTALGMEGIGQDMLNQAFGANMGVSGRPGGMNAIQLGQNFAGSNSSPALVDPLTPLNLAADTATAYGAFNAAEGGALASMLGAQMQADAAQSAANKGLFGSLLGTAGNVAGSAMIASAMSDRRLKTDVTRIGTTPAGIPTYRFRYKGGELYHVGVMAQEAVDFVPEAVSFDGEYFRVDYTKIR